MLRFNLENFGNLFILIALQHDESGFGPRSQLEIKRPPTEEGVKE